MAAPTQSPIFNILGLGLSAFAIHSIFFRRKIGTMAGYGDPPNPFGPGSTIYDPRPASAQDADEDPADDEEGDSGEDEETEEDDPDDFDPEAPGGGIFSPPEIPGDDDAPPPPKFGIKPWVPGTPGIAPYIPPGPGQPGDGGPGPGGVPGASPGAPGIFVTVPIGMKAEGAAPGGMRMVQMPIDPAAAGAAAVASKPSGLAGYYDFNGYGALERRAASPVIQKVLVTLSAYLIVTGLFSMAKNRRR